MRIVLSSMLLLALVLSGCASAAGSGRGGGNFNLITFELLREADAEGLNVHQVIERNRPQWFRAGRAPATLGYAEAAAAFARVVLDGIPSGEINDLRRLNTVGVESIEYISASDATTRFGTGYAGGAILVRMRSGPR